MDERRIGATLSLSKKPDSISVTKPTPDCIADARTVWMITAPLKNTRYELVPVLSLNPLMFAMLANAAVKRTNHTTGWTREKKRNGGRRRGFLIHRPAMLPTSPAKSPPDITSASDGGRPPECVVAARLPRGAPFGPRTSLKRPSRVGALRGGSA